MWWQMLLAGGVLLIASALMTVAASHWTSHRAGPNWDALWLVPLALAAGSMACFGSAAWFAVAGGM